jgi:hypothetical protein
MVTFLFVWCFMLLLMMSRGIARFSIHSAMRHMGGWIPD